MDDFPELKAADVIEPSPSTEDTNPFYIISPPYNLESTHSQILFLLCHYLNCLGESAFIFPYPLELRGDQNWPYFCRFPIGDWQNSRLNTKILTQDVSDEHFKRGLTPICILPEIFDDPIHAPYIARYIIEEPGKMTEKYVTPQHFTFCYNAGLAEYTGSQVVLSIPLTVESYSELPEGIRSLVNALKEGCSVIPYEQQIDLPYSSRIIFIESEEQLDERKWRRRPFKLRDRIPPKVSLRSRVRLLVLNWLLPPKFSQIFVVIRNLVFK